MMTKNEVLSAMGFSFFERNGNEVHFRYTHNKKMPEDFTEEYPDLVGIYEAMSEADAIWSVLDVGVPLGVGGCATLREGVYFTHISKVDFSVHTTFGPRREVWVLYIDGRMELHLDYKSVENVLSMFELKVGVNCELEHFQWTEEWDYKKYAPLIRAIEEQVRWTLTHLVNLKP